MKYMGSKNRHAKELLPIILKHRKEGQWYVEPFVGGANMIDKVEGKRIGNDYHKELISMWNRLQSNWNPPEFISKEEHKDIRVNKVKYPPELVGWVGFNCSYSGVYFGGYAGKTNTKTGLIRDYQSEAIRNVKKQLLNLKGVLFLNKSYDKILLKKPCVIYCDPPYENTSGYKNESGFDHVKFWQWCRDMAEFGHHIFISEYNAPEDFTCVWEKKVNSQLSANGKSGGSKDSIEKLFIHQSQLWLIQ